MDRKQKTKTQRGLIDALRDAPMPMPRSQAELFQLLAFYDSRSGLNGFLDKIDFTDVIPAQIHQSVFGCFPEPTETALPSTGYDPKEHFRQALVSSRFRYGFQSAFLRAYPTKRREIFIHVPKCAGTDLILNLGDRLVPVPRMLEIEKWATATEFLEIVGGLARALMRNDTLFAYGHMELAKYASLTGVRPEDHIFTVLRDPVDQMISQANYAVGRLRQDPTGQAPDAAEYMQMLGLTRLPEEITRGELKELAIKALFHPDITGSNRACFFLGLRPDPRYEDAIRNLVYYDVEVTTTLKYNQWLRQRWGISESQHHNRSESILPNAEARRLYGPALIAATREDQKLFDAISWALEQTGEASVTGRKLAGLLGSAGRPMSDGATEVPLAPARRTTTRNILVAEGPKAVEMYLAPVSQTLPNRPAIETVLSVELGAGAGSRQYLTRGWANPEAEFTWTAAKQCLITLPPLRGDGTFVIRLVVSPFVVKKSLPRQSVELLLGETSLGRGAAVETAVIEAEIPAELVRADEALALTLLLPEATRPIDIIDSKDERLLAFAVRGFSVLRIIPAQEKVGV